ncbi:MULTISPECIES: hypothetical protein [Paenibacillus]|uniref:Uncharacterized protein n=1 Tax=Paenibacillus vini TaxID=1476024 RepID=A0ABQ4MCL7_9BACL|nr:hypothetical protein [Paenibacillus vini]MDN4068893.1 hypothetical protein [Paenibacillus vini]GIP53732.1 hypothetical protein J42TS3_27670 [Paenibacillus vini]
MLSEKVVNYCKSKNWWFEDILEEYKNALIKLGIDLESDFAAFYLHAEDGPTFIHRRREIYQICWFMVNSSDYRLGMERTHAVLKLPEEYIPLDNFEGEFGFFYNKYTDEVLGLGLGQQLEDFFAGKLNSQWKSFNSFLEWYFELTDSSVTI